MSSGTWKWGGTNANTVGGWANNYPQSTGGKCVYIENDKWKNDECNKKGLSLCERLSEFAATLQHRRLLYDKNDNLFHG